MDPEVGARQEWPTSAHFNPIV